MRSKVTPTALDRLVGWVNPEAGLRRLRARAAYSAVGGYLGARKSRNATAAWAVRTASADADTLGDLDALRARSRDLTRNDGIALSAVSTKVTNVIGTGHVVRPEIDADRLGLSPAAKVAWERDALAVWSEWAESRDCDLTRTQTFAEMEDLVYRSSLESGDALVLMRDRTRPGRLLSLCLQVVEADRLSNPNRKADSADLAGGVELDADGAPVAYHIADEHDISRRRSGKVTWRRVPARDRRGRPLVLHIHGARTRPDMTRYAPMLAPVIESLKQRSRYTEAELMAAVVSACFAVGMKSADGDLSEGLPQEIEGAAKSASSDISITEPGQIYDLLPGEEVMSFQPGRPNALFEPFVTAIAQEVGAGLDLPQELLLKSFKASYSASRAAMEIAWQVFRVDRGRHVIQFCRPVYADVISEAVARGILNAPGFFESPLIRRAWLGSVWMGPARPTLDPVKDANADKTYLEMGATTLTRIAAERFGVPWEQVRDRRAQEIATAPAASAASPVAASQEVAADPSDDDTDDDTETTATGMETRNAGH